MKNNDIRSRIIDTAAELFIMQDFSAVSIRNISEHAAVNISSIYYYYESKVDLLENLLLQAEQSFNRVLSTKHLNTPAQLFQSLFDLYYTKILNNEKPTLIFFFIVKAITSSVLMILLFALKIASQINWSLYLITIEIKIYL